MVTRVAAKNIEAFVDLGINHAELLIGVATTNPVDAGIVGFPRDTGPDVALEAMEGEYAGAVSMPGRLPTIDEAGTPQGGVGGASGCDVEVAHDDGGQVGEGGELAGNDVDGFGARLRTQMIEMRVADAQLLPTGDMGDDDPIGYPRPATIPRARLDVGRLTQKTVAVADNGKQITP